MNLEELKTLATKIIDEGFMEGKSEDDIKMDMFAAKIPFSKLNSLYKSIAIELGHIVDPKVVAEGVNGYVDQVDWDGMGSWDEVQTAIDGIVGEVNGATPQRVLALVRSYCKNEEIELPKKPKGAGGGGGGKGGKIASAIAELFKTNKTPTKQDFYDAILPNVKGHRNATDVTKMYLGVCLAVTSGRGIAEVMEELNKQPWPKDNTGAADEEFDDDEAA